MKKLLMLFAFMAGCSPAFAVSWNDVLRNSEGEIVKFTVLNSVSPSYFYNAFSGRSEIGATTQVLWIGSFVSADIGYSVPNAQDGNAGTVVGGGNLHIDKLISKTFPVAVEVVKAYIPDSMDKFFSALNLGVYVGHDFMNKELAGGLYSSLELKF